MKYRKKIILSALLLLPVIGSLFLTKTFVWWGTLLFLFSSAELLILCVLYFVSPVVFQTWKKFAIIYLPLAFIWILMTPTSSGFLQADREIVTWWTSGGFLISSFLLIAWKSWRLRRDKKR